MSAASAPVTEVRFRIDRARLEADALGKSETDGPNVVVFPEKDTVEISGEWKEGGEAKGWKGSLAARSCERWLVRVGGEKGVVLVRLDR